VHVSAPLLPTISGGYLALNYVTLIVKDILRVKRGYLKDILY
jgi:hypothetical protein